MTDFQQELIEPAAIEQGFWESTRYPSYLQSTPSGGTQRQPAAALIAAVTELADVIARKRAPRMDGLRVRLQRSDGSRELGDLEVALRGLHRASAELDVLAAFVDGKADGATLAQATARLKDVASHHRGSQSLDGSAHAAVSATYAVANALAGRALEAASYAAYATVYAYGGYAVQDRSAFEPEHQWQVQALQRLLDDAAAAAPAVPARA